MSTDTQRKNIVLKYIKAPHTVNKSPTVLTHVSLEQPEDGLVRIVLLHYGKRSPYILDRRVCKN